MKIVLEIPKEFEKHFITDKFKDSLMRLGVDIHSVSGNYEKELVDMLIPAFRNAEIIEEKEGKLNE